MSPLLLLLLSATALQRLAELRLSRRNLHWMREQSAARGSRLVDSESARAFAVMVFLQVALLLGPAVEQVAAGRRAPLPLAVGAVLLWAGGQGLRLASQRALGRWWNARGQVLEGQPVVATGVYRLVRHPNYLGVLLEAVALPLAGGAWLCLAVLTPAVAVSVLRRMRAEERALAACTDWGAAFAGVPRMIPRRARRGHDTRTT